ncbi:hypothetical protein VDGE_30447 [Verticillium dahliae]|uniref:Uncharacterized protein n=1 Tax=Verticillium dahliae TaxID=27337 RepID=A0A444RUH6_VERDA|nr:hypothetical protein VDGE_30447 [Verticillium dahliae]
MLVALVYRSYHASTGPPPGALPDAHAACPSLSHITGPGACKTPALLLFLPRNDDGHPLRLTHFYHVQFRPQSYATTVASLTGLVQQPTALWILESR